MGLQASKELWQKTCPTCSTQMPLERAADGTRECGKCHTVVKDDTPVANIKLRINGEKYTVDQTTSSRLRLVDFIRDVAHLPGTKVSCREGGCGACIVTARIPDRPSQTEKICAVNSCLIPVMLCDDWDITTVEGLGNRHKGHHDIQKRLAQFNGSQCGFCSPGMVMIMNSVQEQNPKFTMKDAEDNMDGNICRCTGFRPILDSFKSFASDASDELKRRCADIEDLRGKGCCGNPANCCRKDAMPSCGNQPVWLKLSDGAQWFRPTTLDELFQIVEQVQDKPFRFVGGNTGSGVFKNEGPFDAYIDLNGIPELRLRQAEPLTLGGAVTISEAMAFLTEASQKKEYGYLPEVLHHLQKLASHAIRDMGTLAGNLVMKHVAGFASDLFLPIETVGVKVTISSLAEGNQEMSLTDFLNTDMKKKVLLNLIFPKHEDNLTVVKMYKVLPRYQFSHAYVNAGFLAKVDPKKNYLVTEQPRIVYGGINPKFVRATRTEQFLKGKSLNSQETLNGALKILQEELVPDNPPVESSPEFRKSLSLALFYKYFLFVLKDVVDARLRTGADQLERGVSYGKQDFDTDQSLWPVSKPIMKLEAMNQCSGEAEYINDMPHRPNELHGAFVLTTVANATIQEIDPSEALKMDGVVAFFKADDIPGTNNAMLAGTFPEEVFCSGPVKYAGQSVGIIVAENTTLAVEAAKKVKIQYRDVKKPILTIKQAIHHNKLEPSTPEGKEIVGPETKRRPVGATHTLRGEFETGHQYHFNMETQTCFCIPTEDGMDVYAATQWIDHVQNAISQTLGITDNSLNMQVRRLGGAYGAKISRAALIAAGCALAAQKLNRPVRCVLDIDTNMKMIGRRLPYLCTYEVVVDDTGKIQNMKSNVICDCGIDFNETTSFFAAVTAQNCYNSEGWRFPAGRVITNTASNTYCRSPGTVQGIALIENIMEHIARELKMDPWKVREVNFMKKGDQQIAISMYGVQQPFRALDDFPIPKMVKLLKDSSNYDTRRIEIDEFNKANRWRKKGLAMVPMRWPMHIGISYPVFVAVHHEDGSVAVTHGGIEMGQGINTKVAQAVAYELGIDVDMIKIKPTNNLTGANSGTTGGAMASELNVYAALQACKELLGRMKPFKEKMKNPTWISVVTECFNNAVDLTAKYMYTAHDPVKSYNIWGLTATEVELDALTGQTIVRRVDLVEDAGLSTNPEVDIGQVEGAFVMGLGMWTSEKFRFNTETGELLTHNTWEYKPPSSRDIPEKFYVTLLKNTRNPFGVLQSKATGEPPLCMASCVLFAMRDALDSVRKEVGRTDWYQMNGPTTVEDTFNHCLSTPDKFVLK